MKKSQKISLAASLFYIVFTLAVLALVEPSLSITAGLVPVIVYILIAASFVCPAITYIITPRIERLEEEEKEEDKKNSGGERNGK